MTVAWWGCLMAALSAAGCSSKPGATDDDVAAALKQAFGGEPKGSSRLAGGSSDAAAFYRARRFAPGWTGSAALRASADHLLAVIRDAYAEGLRPSDYRVADVERTLTALREAPEDDVAGRVRLAARAEILLTDAFLLYASHLSEGKVDPEKVQARWVRTSRRVDLPRLLSQALRAGTVADALAQLLPGHAAYRNLRAVRRAWHTQLEGLPDARRREIERRIERLDLNLERWRWMPRDLGARHVLVDTAAFELAEVDGGRDVMRMKIVVGTDTWQTPDFSSTITDFSINPSWNAPRHVLVAELLAYMKQDVNYLKNNKMVLLRRQGDAEVEVDPATIDFATIETKDVDFRLRQDGGPLNVLGRYKFNSPNPYDVYLHDTPYQEDFGKMPRMFSHGCVRVEKPVDFSLFLLGANRAWTRERLAAAVAELVEKRVRLPKPVPTHVLYVTAWATASGGVQWREDVYKRDAKLRAALAAPPPGSDGRTTGPHGELVSDATRRAVSVRRAAR